MTNPRVSKQDKQQRLQWAMKQIDRGVGFSELAQADAGLAELAETLGIDRASVAAPAAAAADPDAALQALLRVARRDADALRVAAFDERRWSHLWLLLGASRGFGYQVVDHLVRRYPKNLVIVVCGRN